MANTKKTAKRVTTGRKGGKSTARRNSGRTAKAAGSTEEFKVPRTAKQLAGAIQARMKRSPAYWDEVRNAMQERAEVQRAAQVVPRENGAAGDTH